MGRIDIEAEKDQRCLMQIKDFLSGSIIFEAGQEFLERVSTAIYQLTVSPVSPVSVQQLFLEMGFHLPPSQLPSTLPVPPSSPLHVELLEILYNCEIGFPISKVDHVLDLSFKEDELIEVVDHLSQQRFDVDYPLLLPTEIRDDFCLKNNSSAPLRGHYFDSRPQYPLLQSLDELLQSFCTFQHKFQIFLPPALTVTQQSMQTPIQLLAPPYVDPHKVLPKLHDVLVEAQAVPMEIPLVPYINVRQRGRPRK